MNPVPVCACIPTYRREQVLLETLSALLQCDPRCAEIIVVDQTARHEPATEESLAALHRGGHIRWLRLEQPSIPAAMNAGLLAATQPLVMFLDDDIVPDRGLALAHACAAREHPGALIAGRVLQPWDADDADSPGTGISQFAGRTAQPMSEFIGCNFSVGRDAAVALGGFDENFVRVAYRFEAEFAHRWRAAGHSIWFDPAATLRHLKAGGGGTRSFGEHLTTWRPDHAVGAYYWSLRTRAWQEFARRPLRSVATRFHLRHPWRIPPTLWSELGGMAWALRLNAAGPRYIAAEHRP